MQLIGEGFSSIRERVEKLEKFSRGWRSSIYRGYWEGELLTFKVASSEEKIYAIRKEGRILECLLGLEAFPQIKLLGKDFIAYSFIDALPFKDYRGDKVWVLKSLIKIALFLDSVGINHGELNRIDKNVLVGEGKVYLIDFERGGFSKKTHNFTQLLQVFRRLNLIKKEEAVRIGREYRRGRITLPL